MSRPRCDKCNVFLKHTPDREEIDHGVDKELEFGTSGDLIATPWTTHTEVRICSGCGHENREEAA